jgi:hypothetical protein
MDDHDLVVPDSAHRGPTARALKDHRGRRHCVHNIGGHPAPGNSSPSTGTRPPSGHDDHFPDAQSNLVPIQLSMGPTIACSRPTAIPTGSSTLHGLGVSAVRASLHRRPRRPSPGKSPF